MKKDKKELDDTRDKVKLKSLFPNLIAIKHLDLSNLKIKGKNFKKTFESSIETTLQGTTLFNKDSINYLNINLMGMLSYLLKPYCKNFVFNVNSVWVNKYNKNDYQGSHVHPSGKNFFIPSYEPNLKQGDIIVFPSYLEHWVKPNSNNITVAGNIKIVKLIKN